MKSLISSIFNGVSLAILITNGNPENPLVVYQNKRFTETTGYEPHELFGKNPKIMQGILTDRNVVRRLKDSLRNGTQFIGSTYNYRKSGEPYPICWTVFPVTLMKRNFFVALIEDLSDFKGDETQKILLIQKNARSLSVEMLNRIQMAADSMVSAEKGEIRDFFLMIEGAVEMIKELNKIVEYSITLMISKKKALDDNFLQDPQLEADLSP